MTRIERIEPYAPLAQVFDCMQTQPGTVFLDSSSEGDLGRFSILGLSPYLVLEQIDGRTFENGREVRSNLSDALKGRLARLDGRDRGPQAPELPFCAGALGFFSYDYGRAAECGPSRHVRETRVPDAWFAFHDLVLVEDRRTRTLWACYQGESTDIGELSRTARTLAAAKAPFVSQAGPTSPGAASADFTKAEYERAVRELRRYIERGHTYVGNLTQRMRVRTGRDPRAAYRALREGSPAPYSAYIDGGDWKVLCSSMERFARSDGKTIETRPIKGTRKRGAAPDEDAAMRRELERSEKERSELLMIVDLERNDLARVCRPDSVAVPSHCAVEEYATVFHLVSTVAGTLRDGVSPLDALESAFPGGSVTGAPKIETMRIIDELERSRRGLYTGSIGYLSARGGCDFNIVIRTAVWEDGAYTLGVGGGITYDSDPAFEYDECLLKAKAVLEAIGAGGAHVQR